MKRTYLAAVIGGIAVAVISGVAAAVYTMGTTVPTSIEQSANDTVEIPKIFAMDSTPYGKSYAEWNGAVWKYFQEIPSETNPGNDATGELCNINQNDSNVWYMINTFGGKHERTCTIPEGRALVVLIGGISCSFAEDPTLKTGDDLRKCAEDNVGSMIPRASIDGVPIQNVKEYYSVSPVTPINLPEGDVWGVGPAETEFVSASWVLVIEPLSEGKHVLQYSAEERDFTGTNEVAWSTEVVWDLTITNSTRS